MESFWQYLTVQTVLTERKTSLPSIVKNNGKQGLKLSKVRMENWLAQISRKRLTERKPERTRMKTILSVSPSSVFSHKVYNFKFEKQMLILYPN